MVTKAPHGVATRLAAYQDFQGLDSTRDITALDTGKQQHLAQLQDAFADSRGQITLDPGATRLYENRTVIHAAFYASAGVCWATDEGEYVIIKSDTGKQISKFARGSVMNSTVFNRKAHFFSFGQQSWYFDGEQFKLNTSAALDNLRPGLACTVGRRLAVAGIPGLETQVHLSRVDDHETFPGDEDPKSTNTLRASFIDIANVIGRAEPITALGRFEQSKLAVFTPDRAIIYAIGPDVASWAVDERASINVGCISHATVQNAGEDLLFCSRSGIHALRRSNENGLTITQAPFAEKIDLIYRALLRSVARMEDISAVWDQDMRQYHIFFPQPGGLVSRRLTMTLGGEQPKWSTGTFLNARCGAAQGGSLLFGAPDGLYQIGKIESDSEAIYPKAIVTTPVLWHGSLTDTKSTHSLIIQAHGKGKITLEAFNDEGAPIGSDVFEVDDARDDNSFPDVPLSKQYERKWEHRYRGALYRMTIEGKGLLRVVGFAVVVRKE